MESSNQDRQNSRQTVSPEVNSRHGFARRIDCAEAGERSVRPDSRATRGRGIRDGEHWALSPRDDRS
jgi:hypothetical protein